MNPFKTDLVYEEAGRNPEIYDELLKRLQQARGFCRACLFGFFIVAMAVCILGLASFEQFINSINNLPPFADLPEDRLFKWIFSNRPLLWVAGGWIVSAVAVQFILMLHYDSRIKMLLFLRPRPSDTAVADGDIASMMTKQEFSKTIRTGQGWAMVCLSGSMVLWIGGDRYLSFLHERAQSTKL